MYSKALGGTNYDIATPRRFAENVLKDEKLKCAIRPENAASKHTWTKNKILRCEAAAANGQETLSLFVASLIAANYAGVPVETINTLAGAYLGSRVAYNFTYIFLQENRNFAPPAKSCLDGWPWLLDHAVHQGRQPPVNSMWD
ncbi:hypothetical protein NUW58_g2988 [Xylaria curta]|uniref:Uncharacterized protein n=1 Tax=Xylaria curta TaxID=42375 RepID=A0ACC1PD31_9PEZI|nr:hypothetical protein NUW58_g2988 [Xylaria curta]